MTYKYTILFSLIGFGVAIAILAIAEDVWHVPLHLRDLRVSKKRNDNQSTPPNWRQNMQETDGVNEPNSAENVNNQGRDGGAGGACAPGGEQNNTKKGEAAPEEPKKEYVELPGGGRLYLKPEDQRRIELDGLIIQQNAMIELIACAEGGKDHESIIAVKCSPEVLHAALLLMGLRDKSAYGGGGPKRLGDPTKPVGDPMVVLLRWEEDGKVKEMRAEDLVIDVRTKGTLRHVGWVFSGSAFVDEVDIETGKLTGRQIYLANQVKTLVATYHDPAAILDLPIEEDSNYMYYANGNVLPPRGTKATLILRPPTAAELEVIQATQKEIESKKAEEEGEQEPQKED